MERFYNWYYPPSTKTAAYPSYGFGSHRRSRLDLAWHSLRRRVRSSWLGRKFGGWAGILYEWFFPLVASKSYGYGYGQGALVRVSLPGLWMRRALRWFRQGWLGRKVGWVLDEVEDLASQLGDDVAQTFGRRQLRLRLTRWQTWVALGCLITATWCAFKYGLPRYHHFWEQNYARQAQMYLTKGDFPRAMLRTRQVLALNPDNLQGIRMFADIADYFSSPYALQWRRRLVFLKPDATNILALAQTALRAESFPFPTATKSLQEIPPAQQHTPAYHLVAGTLAIKLNHLPEAEAHYAEALKLNPDDPLNRMSLAVVRLQSGNPKLITDSRTTLQLLTTDRRLGLLAKRSLVAESIVGHDFARAEVLSQEILTNQQVSFGDRMVHLAILKVEKSPRFEAYLGEMRQHAGENPIYVGELASWMNRYGYAQATLDWVHGLPPPLKQGLVPIAVADAYVALGKWKELTLYLSKERWLDMDAVRLGMMCLASWKEFGNQQYQMEWQQAVKLAAQSPNTLNMLAAMAAGWGWKQETKDVFWVAARNYPGENWPLTSLEKIYSEQGDTAGLRRVFQALAKKNPTDAQAQNNYAMVSLLLSPALADAHQTAAKLHAAQPDNPVFTSTYAFSLYLQGHPREAASALRALGLARLDEPALAAYYGIFLAAAGDKPTALSYLNKSAKAFLLPEEQALVERARTGI